MSQNMKRVLEKAAQLFFLFSVFLLPTQLGKHFWPDFSIVAGVRVDYLSPTLFVSDIMVVLLLLCSLPFLFQLFQKSLQKKNWVIYLYFITLVIGILFSDIPLAGWLGFVKVVECFFFAAITAQMFVDKNLLQKTVLVFAASMLVQSLLAIVQFYHQGSINGFFYFIGERSFTADTPGIANASIAGKLLLRPYGTLPHPNMLAAYLLLGIILLLANKKLFSVHWQKLFVSIVLLSSTIALMLSMSRSAIFVGILLLVIYLIRQRQSSRETLSTVFVMLKKRNYLLLFVSLLLGSYILFAPLLPRFFTIDFGEEAFVQREALAKIALQMFLAHPIFGIGLNQFLIQLPGYLSNQWGKVPLQPVHSIYLLILSETGLIGFLFFCYSLFHMGKRLYTQPKFISGSTYAFFAILLLGITDHYFLTLQQGRLLCALIFGVIYAGNQNTFGLKQGKNIRTRRRT